MSGSIYTLATGELIGTLQTGDAPGLVAAKAALGTGGLMQIGPGLEALVLGAGWANISLARVTNTGVFALSRLHMADGADPTKLFNWDLSAVTTGTTRIVTMPNYSGFMLLPVDLGSSGQFLRSAGAGVQPTWAAVPAATNALLDGVNHTDTVAQAVLRGALVVGNSTPKWDRLAVGGSNTVLFSNGSDPSWATVASLTALLQHDLLLHLKPITVTNCSWSNGSTNITHASNGFANVKVGDYVSVGDFSGTNNTGRRVTVWNSANSLTVDATNGNATITNQTFVFYNGDHIDAAATIDSLGVGVGYLPNISVGQYAATGTGTTYQELRGPYRWMGHGSGSVSTDFDVQGSQSTVTLSGFCMRRQGTTNRAYFYPGLLTGDRVFTWPNGSGQVLTDGSTVNVANKTLDLTNKIEMDGTATYTVFTLPAAGGNRLAFDFTGMTALRAMTWPDVAGKVKLENVLPAALSGATPALGASRVYKVTNGGATNMTNITGANDGAEVTLIFTNGNTTVKDTSTTGSFELAGSADFNFLTNHTLKVVWVNADSKWYEVSRSAN